jgi:hypothetical protein
MFDPNQAGLKAAFRAVRALSTDAIDDSMMEPADRDDATELAPFPDEAVQVAAGDGELDATIFDSTPQVTGPIGKTDATVRESRLVHQAPGPARRLPQVAADEDVYDLTGAEPQHRREKSVDRGAVYTLEFPTRCPQCCTEINSVRVSRLLRSQVSFTSTLPRKGYIIVCPECDGILSAELSGLL